MTSAPFPPYSTGDKLDITTGHGRPLTLQVKRRTWGQWRLKNKRYLVHGAMAYEIDLWEIDSHRELVDWLFHVGSRGYGNEEGFFDAMKAIFRPAGSQPAVNGKALALAYWANSQA